MMYRFSKRLALAAGLVLPIGETWRRWGALWDYPPAYLDDLFIGAFFLYALWVGRTESAVATRTLCAAYGFAFAIALLPLAASIASIQRPDPAGVSGGTAVVAKTIMMALAIAGLVGALRGPATNGSSS
ncbi:MAG: hypothetical protein U0Q16_26715 [Bryobacteraceae bacterium]